MRTGSPNLRLVTGLGFLCFIYEHCMLHIEPYNKELSSEMAESCFWLV